MFNMGGGELFVVALLALLFIPPKKLPEVATTLGRLFVKLQSQFQEIKKEMTVNLRHDLDLNPTKLMNLGKNFLEDEKKQPAATASSITASDLKELVRNPAQNTQKEEPKQ